MSGYHRKVENNHSSRLIILFFSLLAVCIFNPSEYLECESFFPDENPECSPGMRDGLSLAMILAGEVSRADILSCCSGFEQTQYWETA